MRWGLERRLRILSALSGDRLTEREARQYLRLDGAELSELAEELGSA